VSSQNFPCHLFVLWGLLGLLPGYILFLVAIIMSFSWLWIFLEYWNNIFSLMRLPKPGEREREREREKRKKGKNNERI
jgi:hypothetical protein